MYRTMPFEISLRLLMRHCRRRDETRRESINFAGLRSQFLSLPVIAMPRCWSNIYKNDVSLHQPGRKCNRKMEQPQIGIHDGFNAIPIAGHF